MTFTPDPNFDFDGYTSESDAYWRGYHDAERLHQEGEMPLWLIKFTLYSLVLIGSGMVLIKAIIDYV